MAALVSLYAIVFYSSLCRIHAVESGRTKSKNADSKMLGGDHQQYGRQTVQTVQAHRSSHELHYEYSNINEKDLYKNREMVIHSRTLSSSDELKQNTESAHERFREEKADQDLPSSKNSSFSPLRDKGLSVDPNSENHELGNAKHLEVLDSLFDNFTENANSQLAMIPAMATSESNEALNLTSSEAGIKRLPKAIIIGAKKAGTRALLEFLRLHPNVEGTGPEPHFFDRNYDKGLDWYRDLMPKTQDGQITVEKTPGYFVTRAAPRRIFDMDPGIKLILVVRDPVTRAISDYCQAMSKHAMKPFEKMALLDERRGLVNTSWGAIKIGVYAKHMEHWLQVFPLDQIHLVDGQKLVEEPARELAKVETFLGLSKFINDSHFYLRGFKGTFPCLNRDGRPHCLDEKTKGREHPIVKESVIQRLRDFYRPFNIKFYHMVGRNFEWS